RSSSTCLVSTSRTAGKVGSLTKSIRGESLLACGTAIRLLTPLTWKRRQELSYDRVALPDCLRTALTCCFSEWWLLMTFGTSRDFLSTWRKLRRRFRSSRVWINSLLEGRER